MSTEQNQNSPTEAAERLVVVRPAELPLTLVPTPPEEVLEGSPIWKATDVWTSPDGSKMTGAFHSTPGRFRWFQAFHEMTYVMSGHMIVTLEDGTSVDLKAGDMVQVLPGTRCEIEVVETVHDFFVVTSTDGPVSI